ncbi:MAG: hypothetical protein AABX72_02235 [Nanoarchaeota archaeon]
MTDPQEFRKLIDEDLLQLKFLLKSKVASFDDIKKEQEQIIESIKNVMTQVKEMEMVLEQEIQMYKKLAAGWEKAYVDKRWGAIGQTIKAELEDFNQEYAKTKSVYEQCTGMHKRLSKLISLIKNMNAQNKDTREKELKMLEDFRQKKREVMGL